MDIFDRLELVERILRGYFGVDRLEEISFEDPEDFDTELRQLLDEG